jgi:hypothetical protein
MFAFPKNNIRVTQIFKGDTHPGIDFGGVRIGDDIIWAIGDGEVIKTGYQANGAGNYVQIYHPNEDITSIYFHLEKIYVKKGDKTNKNTKLGIEGSTGNSTGPHLHFGLYKGVYTNYRQNYLNPLGYLYAYPEQSLYIGSAGNQISSILIYQKEHVEKFRDGETMALQLENEWQWSMLEEVIKRLMQKEVIIDQMWLDKVKKRTITTDELSWLTVVSLER